MCAIVDEYPSFDPEELEQYALRGRDGFIVERVQHTFMRFAVATHGRNIERITATYISLSEQRFIPPLILLRTAGTTDQTLSSESTIYLPLLDGGDAHTLMGTLAYHHSRFQNTCVSLQRLNRDM